MAGLYMHIPFCRRKCHYCNFYSLASVKYFDKVIDALQKEILQRAHELDEPLQSIYFGGGTPSMLEERHLTQIMHTIFSHFTVSQDAEITFEANPEDITEAGLQYLHNHSINRLSLGVQSFYDLELQYLNRIHSAQTAINAVELAQKKGFHNISIDLIYGLPNATAESWKSNLERAFKLNVPHLSCYALTIEPQTALARFIEKGQMENVSDEAFEKQFEILIKETEKLGYQQYEISNFCRDNYYAVHNTNYWFGKKYLGIGPSAHSFDGTTRQWNVAHLKKYVDSVKNGQVSAESETLTRINHYNEFVMTRLRTQWGVDSSLITKHFDQKMQVHFTSIASKYLNSGHLTKNGTTIRLSEKGKFISDGIIADLFFSEDQD